MKTWAIVLSLLLVALFQTFSTPLARTWLVRPNGTGDVPTIQAGVEAAEHGDTILCTAGTYSWSNQGTGNGYGMIYILRGSADMVIRSVSGPEVTTLDGQWQGRILFFQGETELTVEGFTFTHGQAGITGDFVGSGFAAHLSSPIVRDCVFRENSGSRGGAYWYGGQGSPQILDCVFEHNEAASGGAIYLINSSLPALVSNTIIRDNIATNSGGGLATYNLLLTIENCTIIRNDASQGGALAFSKTQPTLIRNTTIHANSAPTGSSVYIAGSPSITFENTIIASGALGDAFSVDATSAAFLRCTNIWGHPGDWTGAIAPQLGIDGNFSKAPLFCGPESGDLSLASNSPCAPGNHPDGTDCGLIGAYPVTCGNVPVERRTWGVIKSLFSGGNPGPR